jgi:hypothetical protein
MKRFDIVLQAIESYLLLFCFCWLFIWFIVMSEVIIRLMLIGIF